MTSKPEIEQALRNLGLSVSSTFVPFSQSRNKAEKSPSLNWKITLLRNGRDVLTTDYSEGCGYCPSYKQTYTLDGKTKTDRLFTEKAIALECETGRHARKSLSEGVETDPTKPAIMPDSNDVIWSLLSDSDVLDSATFEEWADSLGFNPDSKKVEKLYRDCLDNTLKLRAAIGDDGFNTLKTAFQDY